MELREPLGAPLVTVIEQRQERRSAFDDFLSRTVVHEQMGGVASMFLVRAAFASDGFLIATLLLFLRIDVVGIGSSKFYLVGADLAAGIVTLLHMFGTLLIPMALAASALKACTYGKRVPLFLHVFYASEPIISLVIASIVAALLILIVVQLVLWVLIAIATFMVICALIAGAFSRDS